MNTPQSCNSLHPRQALRLALSAQRDTPAETIATTLFKQYNPDANIDDTPSAEQRRQISLFFGVPHVGDRATWRITLRSSRHQAR